MTVLIADNSLTAAPEGRVEVRTADGRRLGYFTLQKLSPAPPGDLDEAELERRFNAPASEWFTAAEVEAKMREWGCSQ